jgi:diaminohydroxyphosphoribosylaminopyrimidine deaminase/5-amino-6-(5-phosphoribosylamino)uracil reductase
MNDIDAMHLALAHARRVEGRTGPRPPVGAVVVRDEQVIGSGATAPPYGPHAEVAALQMAGEAARGTTLYVTLEPCSVYIHTPPCTEAILAAGIRRVVVGMRDPNPRVCGKGIEQLRAAGVEVSFAPDMPALRTLMAPFTTYITRGRPFVTAKWAMTLDGKIATRTGDAYWISGPAARAWVHDLRDRVDAILIGAGTARRDNPQLTVRLTPEQQQQRTARLHPPLRVVLTTRGELPFDLHLLQPHEQTSTCIVVSEACSQQQQARLAERGLQVISVAQDSHGRAHLDQALQALAQRSIMHVLLEGGMQTLSSAFEQHCIQHVAAFIAPKLVGGQHAPTPLAGPGIARMLDARPLRQPHIHYFDTDVLIEGDLDDVAETAAE